MEADGFETCPLTSQLIIQNQSKLASYAAVHAGPLILAENLQTYWKKIQREVKITQQERGGF